MAAESILPHLELLDSSSYRLGLSQVSPLSVVAAWKPRKVFSSRRRWTFVPSEQFCAAMDKALHVLDRRSGGISVIASIEMGTDCVVLETVKRKQE